MRVAVLTAAAPRLDPLIGGMVPQRQEQVEHDIARQQEENKDEEAQHEHNPGKRQEEMLWRTRASETVSETAKREQNCPLPIERKKSIRLERLKLRATLGFIASLAYNAVTILTTSSVELY